MSNQPSYYAIIPAAVRYCKNLEPNAKLLYGEITALCNQEGYCWASNRYFAELYDVEIRTVQFWIESLVKNNFILVEVLFLIDLEFGLKSHGVTFPSVAASISKAVSREIPPCRFRILYRMIWFTPDILEKSNALHFFSHKNSSSCIFFSLFYILLANKCHDRI